MTIGTGRVGNQSIAVSQQLCGGNGNWIILARIDLDSFIEVYQLLAF